LENLKKEQVKEWKSFKIAGKTYKYGRENLKIGRVWSPRWLMVFENGKELEFRATSEKLAYLTAFTKIV